MKRRIYIISPFCLSEYPWNWKVYYCVELFSALARRGYIVNWIQPGKSVFNFSLFPSLTHWRNFFVINIGNSITYRWLMPFFLSRLQRVSKDVRPFILIEIIDGKPFDLDLDETFLNIPLIFSLGNQWFPSTDFPGPVLIPDRELIDNLASRGVSEEYLNYIPLGVNSKKDDVKPENKSQKTHIFILDKKMQLKSFVEVIKKEKPEYKVQYLNSKDLSRIASDKFQGWLQDITREKKSISVLSEGLNHIGMELMSQGSTVFIPVSEIKLAEKKESMFFYENPLDILGLIKNMEKAGILFYSKNREHFISWEELCQKVEKILIGMINRRNL